MFPAAVNEQIGRESAASQQYIAIAVYYDGETLPNLAAHFYRQAVEERNHAMMLVQYLLDAGEPVKVPGVDAPKTDFADATAPVALALEQEKAVTEQIASLAKVARAWIESNVTVAGEVEQPHVRPWSTVLRVPTSRGDVWFKAALPGLGHDVGVTAVLARLRPDIVLAPIAVDLDRGWMLLPDGG